MRSHPILPATTHVHPRTHLEVVLENILDGLDIMIGGLLDLLHLHMHTTSQVSMG